MSLFNQTSSKSKKIDARGWFLRGTCIVEFTLFSTRSCVLLSIRSCLWKETDRGTVQYGNSEIYRIVGRRSLMRVTSQMKRWKEKYKTNTRSSRKTYNLFLKILTTKLTLTLPEGINVLCRMIISCELKIEWYLGFLQEAYLTLLFRCNVRFNQIVLNEIKV